MIQVNPFSNITPVVKNLIIINGIFFLATIILPSIGFSPTKWLSAFYPASPQSHPWQILTYMFMHAGFSHLFSNMFGLLFMGSLIEYEIGSKRFLQYYFICGVGALALHFLVQAIQLYLIVSNVYIDMNSSQVVTEAQLASLNAIYNIPILGASGAIYGVTMAAFLLFPESEIFVYPLPMTVKIKYLVPIYIVIELYTGFRPIAGDMVAHFAHLGGALIGFIVIKLWGIKKPNNFY